MYSPFSEKPIFSQANDALISPYSTQKSMSKGWIVLLAILTLISAVVHFGIIAAFIMRDSNPRLAQIITGQSTVGVAEPRKSGLSGVENADDSVDAKLTASAEDSSIDEPPVSPSVVNDDESIATPESLGPMPDGTVEEDLKTPTPPPIVEYVPQSSPKIVNTQQKVPKGAAPKLLLSEKFKDRKFASRGWSQDVGTCSFTYSKFLQDNIINCAFVSGKNEPNGQYDYATNYNFPDGLEEFSLQYKIFIAGDADYIPEKQTLHSFLAWSNKGGTVANSFGTLYFDPYKRGTNEPRKREADWVLLFQDNQATNCAYAVEENGKVVKQPLDVYGVASRSVGGMQQSIYEEPAVRGSVTGNTCGAGTTKSGILRNNNGAQTGWKFAPNATPKPVQTNKWYEVFYYVKLNTPGLQDGRSVIAVRAVGEKEWTVTHQSNSLIFRSNGGNADMKINILGFSPFASSNKYNFNAKWADFRLYSGDAR